MGESRSSGGSTDDWVEVVGRLADTWDPEYDIVDAMDLLVETSTRHTDSVDAGVVLADEAGALHVVASTSERASDVEEEQLGVREGPCWDSAQTGDEIVVFDVGMESSRWPSFVPVALARGIQAAHTFPLTIRGQTIGALNLFMDHHGGLSHRDVSITRALTHLATVAILQQRTATAHATLAEQLQSALESRIVIEQAKGVLASRHDVGMDQAFRRLREHARTTHTKLADVAQRIVDREVMI